MQKPHQVSFLDEICDPRPSSRLMLKEAWPALSQETQMTIIHRVTTDPLYPEDIELLELALTSPNPYIRYLAARSRWLEARSIDGEPFKATLRERLRGDRSGLVQGALVHRDAYSQLVGLGPDPAEVCALSSTARITLLRRVKHPLDWFPKLVRRAIGESLVAAELRSMVEEYLASHIDTKFAGPDLDAWTDRDAQRGLAELWRLAAQLIGHYPESAELLIDRLPARTPGSVLECIPEDALSAMTEQALVALLRRPDVGLGAFRAQVLVQASKPGDELLEAAASQAVAMTPLQFATLLTLPERLPALEYAEGLPLVMKMALKDCYRYKYGQPRFGELTDYPPETFRNLLARLPSEEQRETVKELRKYHLATILAPWPNQPPSIDEYRRSAELIDRGKPWSGFVSRMQRPKAMAVSGDPWATYCNFGRYFDIRENYDALRQFSSGCYPDDVTDGEIPVQKVQP
jgi:hypothetical protein